MGLLTRVARGIAFGDVSNTAVRNILTEISKSIKGCFTEQEIIDTMEFFDWKCPYTGKDFSYLKISADLKDCATDHIYPQNREWCGLNLMGNLVIVDKIANAKKGSKEVEDFLLNDQTVLKGTDMETRLARLQKIKDFQKKYNYDPKKIRSIVSPLLKKRYEEVRIKQEETIENALGELRSAGIKLASDNVSFKAATVSSSKKFKPELIFNPSDEKVFVDDFLKKKEARLVLTYDSGAIKESSWKCGSFDRDSNLRANIQSRPFWRRKKQEGLIKVEAIVD